MHAQHKNFPLPPPCREGQGNVCLVSWAMRPHLRSAAKLNVFAIAPGGSQRYCLAAYHSTPRNPDSLFFTITSIHVTIPSSPSSLLLVNCSPHGGQRDLFKNKIRSVYSPGKRPPVLSITLRIKSKPLAPTSSPSALLLCPPPLQGLCVTY